ncbi:AraC family transcriptional regulator [Rapidithrix thailandica]|uniref:AraC family transcriptional regulator n=1 Tax=Rapidithrix thailandica TaxID=413964 RepID=A0AAW9SIM3_9BACT
MKHKQLYQPFEVQVSDMECWKERPLIYHFFEIVQILEGKGMRTTNQNRFPYQKGSIFLFTPLDCRGFEIETTTRFCSIRFSEAFLGQCKNSQDRDRIDRWLKQLEHIFFHHNRFRELLIQQPGDCRMVSSLIGNLVDEYAQKQSYHEENLQHFVTLILNILSRNVSTASNEVKVGPEPLVNKMLLHIRQHIHRPEKLKISYLASHFHLSENYVSEYFRKFTGESLKQYITHYKIGLVQQRLMHSALTVSQIADELGFTDESHLSKQFKKYKGLSPLEFRKKAWLGISPENTP